MSDQMKPERTDVRPALLERVRFPEQLPPDLVRNTPVALRLRGPLSREELVRTLTRYVRRRSALRTRVLTGKGGEPFRVVAPAPARFPLVDEDLSYLPEGKRMPAVELAFATEALRPFDLRSDLLVRCRLLRLDDEDHILLLTRHRMADDFAGREPGLSPLFAVMLSRALRGPRSK